MKKIHFEAKRPSQDRSEKIDKWVSPKEPIKRLTIDVPLSLHIRVKSRCALENLVMADIVRDLLEQRFPRFESEPSGEAS